LKWKPEDSEGTIRNFRYVGSKNPKFLITVCMKNNDFL
jgi:hypothetical protein